MLLLYAIPIGLLLGLAAGGRLAPLGEVRIRFWPLAIGGLLFQFVLFSDSVAAGVGALGPPLFVGSSLVVLFVLTANLGQPGFRLIMVGGVLNLVVIAANGGQMPSTAEAMLAAHGVAGVPTPHFSNSLVDPDARLLFLGDVFALPRPFPLANVFSIGDVVIALGGAWFVAQVMRRPVSAANTPPAIKALPPFPGPING